MTTRKLAAILHADAAGFSRLMGVDDEGTHQRLAAQRRIIDRLVASKSGRIVGTAGDSVLAEFPSVVDALDCACAMQRELAQVEAAIPPNRRLQFRVGINLGDVIVDGHDLFGDGVNVAARLQTIAQPGGICVSGSVYDQVHSRAGFRFRSLGAQRVKNIAEPVRAYELLFEGAPRAASWRGSRAARAATAVLLVVAAGLAAWSLVKPTVVAPPAHLAAEEETVPAVAVLPFTSLSGDPADAYFSDGLTEDVIAALGRFAELRVRAKSAVAPYRERNVAPSIIGRELAVRYLVDGSVRRSGDKVRVAADLTEAATGRHLWSDRWEGELKDVFALQDELVRHIAGTLTARLARIEQDRAVAKPTENLAAYDYVLRGRAALAAGTRAGNWEARRLFERAIALDPGYVAAKVSLGWALYEATVSGWTEFRDEDLDRAARLAREALGIDEATAGARRLLAFVALARGDHDGAARESALALELNPSDSESQAVRGDQLTWGGQADAAVPLLEDALRADPTMAGGYANANLGLAYCLLRRYEEAVQSFDQALARRPNRIMELLSQVGKAAALAQLGREPEAAQAAELVRQISPFFDADLFLQQFRSTGDRALMAEALRKAGFFGGTAEK